MEKSRLNRIYLVAKNADYERYGWEQERLELIVEDELYDLACELENEGVDYKIMHPRGLGKIIVAYDDEGEVTAQYIQHDFVKTDEYGDIIAHWDYQNKRFVPTVLDYESASIEYGTVDFEGKEYALIQDAYAAGECGSEDQPYNFYAVPHFEAAAIDEDGNDYMVYWDILYPNAVADDDKCDWYNPSRVERK